MSIDERLTRLERSARFWRAGALASVLVSAALLACAAADPGSAESDALIPDELTVRKLTIAGEDCDASITLAASFEKGASIVLANDIGSSGARFASWNGETHLVFFDQAGRVRMDLFEELGHRCQLHFRNPDKRPVLGIGVAGEKPFGMAINYAAGLNGFVWAIPERR